MRKKIRKAIYILIFTVLTAGMLLQSRQALFLSLTGLNLWYQKMIPTLLPFMILSGILIRMNLSDSFARLLAPVLRPVFRLSDSCLYVLVIGFLCGFPMGARVTAESYERGRLTRDEASLMLAFCNNIGPIYFSGFVLPLFGVTRPLFFWLGMYLLPLLYGLFLRYTVYRSIRATPAARSHKAVLHMAEAAAEPSLLYETNDAVISGLCAIASLGGYMILFNLLNLIPNLLLPQWEALRRICACLLEITGGLAQLPVSLRFWGFVLLPFGGLSCIAQTYSMIRTTDLSLADYVKHKTVQAIVAFGYYSILFLIFKGCL